MKLYSDQPRWLLVGLVLLLFLVIGSGWGLSWAIKKLGFKVSGYIAQRVWGEVVHSDGGLSKFQKRIDVDGKEKYQEPTYELPGFILSANENGDLWLLSLYGIQHFIPLTDRQVFYLILDQCIDEEAIISLWQKEGKVTLKQTLYPTFAEWLVVQKKYARPFVAVSYLAEDDKRSVKRYRHIHASDGLIYYNVQREKICPF